MQIPVPLRDFLLVSLPLMLVLVVLEASFSSTGELIWALRLHKSENDLMRQVMFWITDWGNFAIYAVYVALLARALAQGQRGLWRGVLIFAAVQVAIDLVLLTGVKIALGRPRPLTGLTVFEHFSLDSRFHSLPSGHTAEFTGAVLPLLLRARVWLFSLLMGLLTACMGMSRVYLGMHHISDVALGFVLGSFAGFLIYSLCPRSGASERGECHGSAVLVRR